MHTFELHGLYKHTWLTLMNTLEQHNKSVYTTQDQRKYVQTMELSIFSLWRDLAQGASSTPAILAQLQDFLAADGLVFLKTISEYLRRELKIPEYSEMYDDREQLLEETSRLFTEQSGLEGKLSLLKTVIEAASMEA